MIVYFIYKLLLLMMSTSLFSNMENVFVVLHYTACDDYCYGYMEFLKSVHSSFEKAKESVDSFLEKNEKEPLPNGYIQPYDGVGWEPFITIVQMKLGYTERIILYNTTDFERKEQKRKELKEERRQYLEDQRLQKEKKNIL